MEKNQTNDATAVLTTGEAVVVGGAVVHPTAADVNAGNALKLMQTMRAQLATAKDGVIARIKVLDDERAKLVAELSEINQALGIAEPVAVANRVRKSNKVTLAEAVISAVKTGHKTPNTIETAVLASGYQTTSATFLQQIRTCLTNLEDKKQVQNTNGEWLIVETPASNPAA